MKHFLELAGFGSICDLGCVSVEKKLATDQLERKAETYYHLLLTYYGDQRSISEGIRELAEVYYHELASKLTNSSSDRFHTYVVLIRLFRYTCIHDYISTLPICDQVLKDLQNHNPGNKVLTLICLHHKLIAYIQLGEFENGLSMVRQTDQLVEEGCWNWFKNKEYLFLLAMRTGHYVYAARIFDLVTTHRSRSVLTKDLDQHWELYGAYVSILQQTGVINDRDGSTTASCSMVSSLCNADLALLPMNANWIIPKLIAHVLSMLIEQNYEELDKLFRRIDQSALESRLQGDNKRSYCFLKLLSLLPKVNYSRQKFLEISLPIIHRMVSSPSYDRGENQYPNPRIEIIPYETLWRILLKIVD